MGQKILVVEDDPMIRFILVSMLKQSGLEVLEAAKGTEALDLLDRESVDGAILDYYLPDMTAAALLFTLGPRAWSLRILLVSGHNDPILREQMLSIGVDRFVAKDAECAYFQVVPEVMSELLARPLRRRAGGSKTDLEDSKTLFTH